MNKHEYSSPSLDPAARLEAWYCWAASVLEEPAESLPEILEWPPGVPPFDGLLGAGQIRRLPAHPGLGDDPRVLLLQLRERTGRSPPRWRRMRIFSLYR